jgi:hypothetical protein
MGQKSEPAAFDQLFVLGLDRNGTPRGARFTILKDSIVSAAVDMNLRILMFQPPDVTSLAMRLPIGHVHGTGKLVKLFVPPITQGLYRRIMKAAATADLQRYRSPANYPTTKH